MATRRTTRRRNPTWAKYRAKAKTAAGKRAATHRAKYLYRSTAPAVHDRSWDLSLIAQRAGGLDKFHVRRPSRGKAFAKRITKRSNPGTLARTKLFGNSPIPFGRCGDVARSLDGPERYAFKPHRDDYLLVKFASAEALRHEMDEDSYRAPAHMGGGSRGMGKAAIGWSPAVKWLNAFKSNPTRSTAGKCYRMSDGSVLTSAQYKRSWPGGKCPSPAARRLLGITVSSGKRANPCGRRARRNPTRPTFEAAKQRYVHRFTADHVPAWSRQPMSTGQFYAPQYRSDREWYENTVFPGESGHYGPLTACNSHNASWPVGQTLGEPYSAHSRRANPCGRARRNPGTIMLRPALVRRLFEWHGGQSSHLYYVASNASARRGVSVDEIESALGELRRAMAMTTQASAKHHAKDTIAQLERAVGRHRRTNPEFGAPSGAFWSKF